MYSGLATSLEDKDPCGDNFATQVVFFIGSPFPSASYPGLFDTPWCAGAGGIEDPCQTEEIWVRNGVRVNPPDTHRKVGGDIFFQSLERCSVSPSAVMLQRRLFEAMGGFDETLPAAEDYDLWLRVAWRYPVGLVPEPLLIKRGGHPDQLSRQWGLDRFRIRALMKLLQEPGLPEEYRQAARSTLAQKCRIYAQGCEKRGKTAEAREYMALSHKL